MRPMTMPTVTDALTAVNPIGGAAQAGFAGAGLGRTIESIGGLGKMFAESPIVKGSLPGLGPALGQLERGSDALVEGGQTIREFAPRPEGSFAQGLAYDIGGAGFQLGTAVGASMLAGPQGGLAVFAGTAAAPVVGQQYLDARAAGLDENEAALEAGAAGLITAATSYLLPAVPFLKALPPQTIKEVAGRAFASAASEGTQEMIERFATDLLTVATRDNPEMLRTIQEQGTWAYAKQVMYEGLVGAIAGAPGGAVGTSSESSQQPLGVRSDQATAPQTRDTPKENRTTNANAPLPTEALEAPQGDDLRQTQSEKGRALSGSPNTRETLSRPSADESRQARDAGIPLQSNQSPTPTDLQDTARQADDSGVGRNQSAQASDITSLSYRELRELAREMGLETKGTRAVLVERIRQATPAPTTPSRLAPEDEKSSLHQPATEGRDVEQPETPSLSPSADDSGGAVKVGDRVTLPKFTSAPGEGKNYGTVEDAEVIRVTPKFVTVRQTNTPENARMFGPTTDIRIPKAVVEAAKSRTPHAPESAPPSRTQQRSNVEADPPLRALLDANEAESAVDVAPKTAIEKRLVAEAAQRGITIRFVDADKPLKLPGVTVGKTILIDARQTLAKKRLGIAYHEMIHTLPDVDGLTALIQSIDPKGWKVARAAYAASFGKPIKGKALDEEATATTAQHVATYLRLAERDPQALIRLATANTGLMAKVADTMQRALRAVGLHKGPTILERQAKHLKPARVALAIRNAIRTMSKGAGEIDAKFATEQYGRPDLASSTPDEKARGLMAEIDEDRKSQPRTKVTEKEARAEAAARIAANPSKEWDRLVAKIGRGEALNSTETIAAQTLWSNKTIEAVRTGDTKTLHDAHVIHEAWRRSGEIWSEAGRARRDAHMTPAQRQAFALAYILTGSDAKTQARIDRIHKQAKAIQDEIDALARAEMPAKFHDKPVNIIRQYVARIKAARSRMAELKAGAKPQFAVEDSGEWKALQAEMDEMIEALGGKDDAAEIEALLDGQAKKPRVKVKLTALQKLTGSIDKLMAKQADTGKKIRDNLFRLGIHPGTINDEMMGDQRTRSAIARAISTAKAGYWDKQYEVWIQGILSGPKTAIVNTSGAGYAAWQISFVKAAEAAQNLIIPGNKADAATFGEFKAMLPGLIKGFKRAFSNYVTAFSTETPVLADQINQAGGEVDYVQQIEDSKAAIGGKLGRFVRIPGRNMLATDEFVMALFGEAQAHARAYRIATKEGMKGKARAERIEALTDDMGSEAWAGAYRDVIDWTFKNDPGAVGRAVHAIRKLPTFRYWLAFVRTPVNIIGKSLGEFTPLSLPLAIAKGVNTAQARIRDTDGGGWTFTRETAARSAVSVLASYGLLAALLFYKDDEEGNPRITGSNPPTGLPKTSIRIGDEWYSYGRYDPLATGLSVTVDLLNAATGKGETIDGVGEAAGIIVDTLQDKTFLKGLADIFGLFDTRMGGTPALRFASNFAVSWVPNIIRGPMTDFDPVVRDTTIRKSDDRGLIESAIWTSAARAVPLAFSPPPKYDVFGQPIRKDHGPASSALFRMLVPSNVTKNQPFENQLYMLIMDWNNSPESFEKEFRPKPPNNRFVRDGVTYRINDADYQRFIQESGQAAVKSLRGYKFADPPTEKDMARIEKALTDSRKRWRDKWLAQQR